MFDPKTDIDKSDPSAGAGRAVAVIGIAAIIVIAAIAAVVVLNKHKGPVEGQITSIKLYLPQPAKQIAGSDLPDEPVPEGNRMIVLADVTVKNVGKKPLTVQDFSGIIKEGDTDFQSFAAPEGDFDTLFKFYPDLAAQKATPFPRHQTLAPGATEQGLVVLNYNLDEDQWNKSQGFNLEVSFEETKETLELKPAVFPAHERIANVTQAQLKLSNRTARP